MTGNWLDYPFHVDPTGRTALTGEDDHIRDMIEQILFTSPGERVMRPDFGCGLKQLVFMPASDALAASTQQLVQGSLMRWLDGIVAVERVTAEVGEASIEVTVVWRKLDTGERQESRFVRDGLT
ncbi:Gene 25-like lysozyme [Caballeronia peredens]|nr:Gene 25-like lysozyme [Caballeronia peredens]